MKTKYFESAGVSDVGRKRKNNEDACLLIPDNGIFCVADGMGGQAGGGLASEAIIKAVQEVFAKAAPEEDGTFSRRIALFRKAANQASAWIKNFAEEKVIGQMGSTVVALILDPRNPARAVALHAGDSRLYRYRNGQLKQLTSDHSVIESLAAKLGIDPASVPAKYQNELTRAVGLSELVELDKTSVDVLSGDLFLICSDGLTKMLPNEEIAKFLKSGEQDPVATVVQTLISAANGVGGKDNVTVVLVKTGDISGAPDVIDPDEEEESKKEEQSKLMVPPAKPSDGGRPTPANPPGESFQMPETSDTYQGHTPLTESHTPRTEDHTPQTDEPTRDKTPDPDQAAKRLPGTSDGKGVKVTKNVKKAARKKIPLAGIIIGAVIVAAGAGIFFASQLKSKSKSPAAKQLATTGSTNSSQQSPTDEQAQIEAAYGAAMKNAQNAFDNHNYVVVVEWATTALQKMPGDAAAAKLRDDAQKVINEYQEDFQQAQTAYQKGDYPSAVASADKALAIYNSDATVQKLKADALSQIQIQEACREAMRNAQSAFDNQDYAHAEAWAVEVLQNMPGDSAATKLLEDARQQAALEDLNRKYQAAMQDGQEAVKNNDYSLASAKAKEALALKPDDPAAAQLASQTQEPADLENARNFFDQGDYEAVAKLCVAYPGNDVFTRLAKSNRVEQAALSSATALFNNGDYSFTVRLMRQTYGHKTPFVELFNQATNEWKTLGNLETLEQANNWQAVLEKLEDPAFAGLTNKPPFHALEVQAAGQRDLAQLNVTFETMLVWFNVRSPTDSYIQTPEARQAKTIDVGIDETQRDTYLKMADQLEAGYKKGGWLNQNSRAKYISKLRDAITHHK